MGDIYSQKCILSPSLISCCDLCNLEGSVKKLEAAGIAQKAHNIGAKIVHIGSNPNSPLKDIVCLMVRIPVRTKYYLEDEIDSKQPMTSLFEQTLLLLGDVVAKMIIDRKELDMKGLWQYHANLE